MCEKGELESMMCRWTSDFEAEPPASNARPKFVKVSRQAAHPRKPRPRPQQNVSPAAIRDLGPEGKARIAALIRELAVVSRQRAEFEAKLTAAEGEKSALMARRAELEAELEAAKAEQQRQGARIFTERIDAELLLRSLKQESEKNGAVRQECGRCEATRQESAACGPMQQECGRCVTARQECPRCDFTNQKSARCDATRQDRLRCDASRQESARLDATRQESARFDATRQDCSKCDVTWQDRARCETIRPDIPRCCTGQQETPFCQFKSQSCASVTSPRSHVTSTPRTTSVEPLESERQLLERERQLLEREKRCLEAELAARMRLREAEKPCSSRCQPLRPQSPHSVHSFLLRPGLLNARSPEPEAASDDASLAESVTLALADTELETIGTSPRPRDRYLRRPGRQPPSPPSSLLDVIDSLSAGSPRGFEPEDRVDDDENRLLEDLFFVRLL